MAVSTRDDMNDYFLGRKLYGDDFSAEEIMIWYDAESEGYADKLRKTNTPLDDSRYLYYHLQYQCGFAHLPADLAFDRVLGFGSAFGYEFKPIASRVKRLTIVEPSELFTADTVFGIPADYIKPAVTGELPFEDDTFDLTTCFGVLHHIPNVSKVLSQLARCMRRGGWLLVREPICSQGDWRRPRPALTANERGIPLNLFRAIIGAAGLEVYREHPIVFRPFIKAVETMGLGHPYRSSVGTAIDRRLARLFAFNHRYHPTRLFQKFTPMAIFYVLRKPHRP